MWTCDSRVCTLYGVRVLWAAVKVLFKIKSIIVKVVTKRKYSILSLRKINCISLSTLCTACLLWRNYRVCAQEKKWTFAKRKHYLVATFYLLLLLCSSIWNVPRLGLMCLLSRLLLQQVLYSFCPSLSLAHFLLCWNSFLLIKATAKNEKLSRAH